MERGLETHSPSAPHVAHSSCLSTPFYVGSASEWGTTRGGQAGGAQAGGVRVNGCKSVDLLRGPMSMFRCMYATVAELTCGSDMAMDTATRWLHDLAQFTFIYGAFFSHSPFL